VSSQTIAGSWQLPWQESGFNDSFDCFPQAAVVTNTSQFFLLNIQYTFSTVAYTSSWCTYTGINASNLNSTLNYDPQFDAWRDPVYPFVFRYLAQIGTLEGEATTGIHTQFSLVNANAPGPSQSAYASELSGSFTNVIPGSVVVYFWHGPNLVNATSCCIPSSASITINNNASTVSAQLGFPGSVTTNPWCQAENITGNLALTGIFEQVTTTYNATAWSADLASAQFNNFGNAFDFIFFFDNSTLRVGYSVHNQDAQGNCGFDLTMSSTIEDIIYA